MAEKATELWLGSALTFSSLAEDSSGDVWVAFNNMRHISQQKYECVKITESAYSYLTDVIAKREEFRQFCRVPSDVSAILGSLEDVKFKVALSMLPSLW